MNAKLIFDKTRNKNSDIGECHYCHEFIIESKHGIQNPFNKYYLPHCWEIDHIIPKSRGGSDNLSNLVPSCVDCNQSKGDKYEFEFLEEVKNHTHKPSVFRSQLMFNHYTGLNHDGTDPNETALMRALKDLNNNSKEKEKPSILSELFKYLPRFPKK